MGPPEDVLGEVVERGGDDVLGVQTTRGGTGALAFTGYDVAGALSMAGMFLALGGGAHLAARRRRRDEA